MNRTSLPLSPFTTALSGSARETELRIRSIFQWKKQRPPLALFLLMLVIGLCGTLVWFLVFRFLIVKFNFKTPGREDDEGVKFYSKQEYRDKQAADKGGAAANSKQELAAKILEGLGGKDNIVDVTNCATRLRVNVKDISIVQPDTYFKSIGAHGAMVKGKSVQVIVGLSVPKVRAQVEELL